LDNRVVFPPVPGNIDPSTEPHTFVALGVIDKPFQRPNPARSADQAAMQTDRHHPWDAGTFLVQCVKCVS
jgi:hypothetical protein